MKAATTVLLKQLFEEPYASIVCYPRATLEDIKSRIEELDQFHIEALEFSGKTAAANVPVLGKGYVGVVVIAYVCGEKAALKMRRSDADRQSLEHEALMLAKANSINVGPRFLAVSKNFLLMQLIDGDFLEDWLETQKDKKIINEVLLTILEQCWRLDEAGLDHGELSKAPKHLLVDKANKPFIVDFETASLERRVINVTSVCQFLFIGNSQAAKSLAEIFGKKDKIKLITALKTYKKNRNRINFETLIETCLT